MVLPADVAYLCDLESCKVNSQYTVLYRFFFLLHTARSADSLETPVEIGTHAGVPSTPSSFLFLAGGRVLVPLFELARTKPWLSGLD